MLINSFKYKATSDTFPILFFFISQFNMMAVELDAMPSLNQTLGLEDIPSFGSKCVTGKPKERFLSPWLQIFWENQETKSNV
eukprot:Awhi_evm1s194